MASRFGNKRKQELDEVDSEFNNRYNDHKKFRGQDIKYTLNDKIITLDIPKTYKAREEDSASIPFINDQLDQQIDKALDNEESKNLLIEIICKCCVSFPSKVTIYSTLIALINVKNYSACATIVETLCSSYSAYLQAQRWSEALTIVHIFSNLVCCQTVTYTSLLSFFEILLEATIEDNTTQARSDYYVYTVLSSVMYVGQELSSKSKSELDQIMNTVSNHIKKRQHTHLNALRVWLSDDPLPQMDYIDSLWAQISKLKEENWSENFICRPYNDSTIIEKLNECSSHNLQPSQVPADHPSIFYPYPRIVFRLFDEDNIEDEKPLPRLDSISRFYMEHQIRSTIDEYSTEKKFCAGQIINIYNHHTVPIEFILAEFLIGELLTLPLPNKCDVLYSSLILDLCQFSEVKFPAVLAQAIQILYDNLDTMNVSCVDRFVNWFAFHLNNYSFLWSWQRWQDSLSEDSLHPKPVFVRELIVKCIRLSFYTKTAALLKDSLSPLVPSEPAIRDKFLSDEDIVGHDLALELKQMIAKKEELQSYNSILNIRLGDSGDAIDIDEKPSDHLLKIDVFTNVLLNLASKSFTHLFSAVGKFQTVFRALMKTDDSKMQLLKSIHYTWKTHPQLQVVLIDKLLKINLIDVCVVCDWIFTTEMSLESMNFYPWEILNNTVSRQCKQRDAISKKLKTAVDSSTVDQLEEQLRSINEVEEKMFCIVLERFSKLLSEHIYECKSKGCDFKDYWFRWMIGRMQQVFFIHSKYIFRHVETIESLIFSSDMLDTHILLIFKQFLSLRS